MMDLQCNYQRLQVANKRKYHFIKCVFSFHTTTGEEKWYDTVTDANGNFCIAELSNGTYKVEGIWLGTEGKWYAYKRNLLLLTTLN